MNILFSSIYILCVFYLINHQVNLKKAAQSAKDAIYPKTESEFDSILIPTEWKAMEPLTKKTKSYQLVKWGTIISLILLSFILWIVLFTTWLESSIFTLAYIFFVILKLIHHRGNLYILPKGLILFGKYYSLNQVKNYTIEKIVIWHELYGLDPSVNNGYKLSINIKKKFNSYSKFVVIKDVDHLNKMINLLEENGIRQGPKEQS